ncbi:E3 ubiquitin-protein ligase TRIM35-like isoform X1 [Corythoichthys intestinalis]|uniref:E3 ubiquitin-protein ligase TRIM35-like isoform X1 n=2 Tax=Corythoichthys intestinalis TaxID=161448 RepID=UPI0025A52314|nr:E3 ubiquitin-protein ligase TRIM35-like isoform X1 [Corythoichthys intestinalis]
MIKQQPQLDILNLCAEPIAVFSKTMAGHLEDHLQCPTCLQIFNDPVMLPCSHNFCRACLQQWKDKGERSCPICRTEFSSMDPPPNLALRNMCENLSCASLKSEDICSLHEEKLQLFCLDHQELVCHICRDAEIHVGHKFRPLEEVVKGHYEELQKGLQKAKERLKDYNDCRENCNEQAEHIKVQRENVERKIKKDFEELRHFLDVEEEARLAAVREEEKMKSHTTTEKIAALDRQMAALSNLIRSTEEQLASGNVSFMKKFKTAMSRIQELPEKPQLLPGGLLDEAKHVGNLKFKVWERMKETLAYSPVILDPNTANPRISLSEDLNSLSWEDVEQERPKNPERPQTWRCVLGGALDSGRHVWDVEVVDNIEWQVGIIWGDPCLPDEMIGWFIWFRDGVYKKPYCDDGEWNPPVKVQRIRVEVDINERVVSFSEPLTNTELWNTKKPSNWPDLSGNNKMYPYFQTAHKSPLKLIPFPPCVTTAIVSDRVDTA